MIVPDIIPNLSIFTEGKKFGHCLKEPPGTVKRGEQTSATFVSGLLQTLYVAVEQTDPKC